VAVNTSWVLDYGRDVSCARFCGWLGSVVGISDTKRISVLISANTPGSVTVRLVRGTGGWGMARDDLGQWYVPKKI